MEAAEPVPVALLLDGYERACRRFYKVMRDASRDETFIPLFEALNWAASLDERLQAMWKAAPTNPSKWWSDGFAHGDTVRGVRFARNRVHHQWADALWLSQSGSFPLSFPGEWRWRPDLPPGRHSEFEEEYRTLVAGSKAGDTLGDLSLCFAETRVSYGRRR